MSDASFGIPSANDLKFLIFLVDAYHDVPPNRVQPFHIYEEWDFPRGPLPPVLKHPGFATGEFKPDWAALRRLADLGLLNFGRVSTSGYIRSSSSEVVEITESGFELVNNIDEASSDSVKDAGPMNNEVWVVYGRNQAARDLIFNVLWAAGLEPLDFDRAGELTGSASPYVGDVLKAAFAQAQAALVLLSDDEEVCLREEFRGAKDPSTVEYQARPNVIFEAGMAMALQPDRTIIVEMGSVREFTNLSGRHVVKWRDGNQTARMEILKKLHTAGCDVKFDRKEWLTTGEGSDLGLLNNPDPKRCKSDTSSANQKANTPDEFQSIQARLSDLATHIGELAVRVKIGWSTEHAIDQYKIEDAQQVLVDADQELEVIRLSPLVRERPALHKSIDGIRTDFKRLARENPPRNAFRIGEFWWHGDEAIERLEAAHRMLDVVTEHGVDPIDGLALRELRSQKACIFLVDDSEHKITANFRPNSYLLVTIPIRNEGGAIARGIKLSSVASELDEVQAHPEGEIDRLEPEKDDELWFAFLPGNPEGSEQAHESRFRIRIDFRDGLGSDSVGYVIRLRDAGNRTFRGWVVPERTVASPFCPQLAFDFRASGDAQ